MSATPTLKASDQRSEIDPDRIRVAFYGRNNIADAGALRELARQSWTCERAVDGRGMITCCFYDLPVPIDEIVELVVRCARGPSPHDGGWDELADALATSDPGFDIIIVATLDRLSRDSSVVLALERVAAQHCVPIVYADEPWDDPFEMVAVGWSLTAFIRRRFIAPNFLTIGREV